jgi:hypothetical protein
VAAACGFTLMLCGCDPGRDQAAADGRIEAHAPVLAVADIAIRAPATKVWSLLTDIQKWPEWQPGISDVSLQGDGGIGTTFVWTAGSMTIHSTIRRFEPQRAICWTGRALIFHAIHCWQLESRPDGTVLVRMRESMSGFLLGTFYSSRELLESDRAWLERLKHAAEG